MRLPVLDERLSRAAALFPACAYGADIGADHGRLSCYLLGSGKCERMCVADISADSLDKARRLLALHELSERADISVGDGLLAMEQQAQSIAILGMGGHTLSSILINGQKKLLGATLILSAHTQLPLVRKTLMELQYHIDAEEIAHAAGRYYVILRAKPGGASYSKQELFLGPVLMQCNSLHYPGYLKWRIGLTACKRTPETQEEIRWLKEEYRRVCNGSACPRSSE